MTVITTPHLNFRGDAGAALDFYHSVFGGQKIILTNADAHSVEIPEEAEQVGREELALGLDARPALAGA